MFEILLVDPKADEAALSGRMAELERVKARAAAQQARIAAELEARRVAAAAAGGPRVSRAALGSERLMAMARILVADMPCTLAALESGVLSEHRAELITKEAECLSVLDRRLLDAELCSDPAILDGKGDAEITAEAKRIAYRLDQEAIVQRVRRAPAGRHVRFQPAGDGMATVSVRLPAAEGRAMHTALSDEAASTLASTLPGTTVPAGLGRTHDQIMVDVMVQRVTGRNPVQSPVPVTANLVLSDETLLGGGSEPAHLEGYGPIPAEIARDLVVVGALDAAPVRPAGHEQAGGDGVEIPGVPESPGPVHRVAGSDLPDPVLQRQDSAHRPHPAARAAWPDQRAQRSRPMCALQLRQRRTRLARGHNLRPARPPHRHTDHSYRCGLHLRRAADADRTANPDPQGPSRDHRRGVAPAGHAQLALMCGDSRFPAAPGGAS